MKQFELYDPRHPQPDHQVLRIFNDPMGSKDEYFLIHRDDHLLIYDERLHTYPVTAGAKAGTTRLFRYQFTMPLPGIRWFIDVIEQKFFKLPEDGGLQAHKLSYEEMVAGEHLHVMRSMGGGDRPGYTLTNAAQRAHGAERNPQRLNLSDRWLFQDGLMDYLKELADNYGQGQL